MSWKATVQDPSVLIEECIYNASPIRITETMGKFGTITRIDFKISTFDEYDGREVHGLCSTILSEKSKLGKWIKAIIGKIPAVGNDVTEEDILNHNCGVVVKRSINDNDFVFANVTDVLSAEGAMDEYCFVFTM